MDLTETSTVPNVREILLSYVFVPLWDMLFSGVEIFVLNLPRPIGYEGADKYAICGQMLGRGSHEITVMMFDHTCLPMFREKFTSVSYTLILLLILFSCYFTFLTFYRYLLGRTQNDVAVAAIEAGRDALIVASNQSRRTPQNQEVKEKIAEGRIISAQVKAVFQQIVYNLENPSLNDEGKIQAISWLVRNIHPAVRRDIRGDLVAAANIQGALLAEAEAEGKEE